MAQRFQTVFLVISRVNIATERQIKCEMANELEDIGALLLLHVQNLAGDILDVSVGSRQRVALLKKNVHALNAVRFWHCLVVFVATLQ